MGVVKETAADGTVSSAQPSPVPRMALQILGPSKAYRWVMGAVLALMAATVALAIAVY